MAVDARILNPNITRSIGVQSNLPLLNFFNSALNQQQARDVSQQALDESQQQQPFRNQLLELETNLRQAQQPAQLQIAQESADPLAQINRRDKARLQSITQAAVELNPLLESDDIEGARSVLIARKSRLKKIGLPTNDTDEALSLLNDNPDLLKQRTQQAIKLGQQAGFIKPITGQGIQATQFIPGKGFATITKGGQAQLVPVEGVGETTQEKRIADIAKSSQIEGEKSRLQGLTAAKKLAVTKSGKAFDKLAKIDVALANFDDAIRAIDEGASTGTIASRLPSFRKSSIELDNIQKSLGLDVVGNTTFGALSESELAFALKKALPTDLQPADLKVWLQAKKAAQQKLRGYISEAAQFLGTGENTIPDWLELQQAKSIISQPQQDSFIAPQAAPSTPDVDLSTLSIEQLIALRSQGGN